MSIFNPTPQPVQDPNYLFWSRPISGVEGNKSSALAIQGAGETLDLGVKDVDFMVKSKIEDDIHSAVDSEHNRYIAALQAKDPILQSGQPTNILGSTDNQQAVPPQIKDLPKTAETLGQARANGRLSETDYLGRMDTIFKDFRARFPGHRDYIDEVSAKAMNAPSANQYIRSMLGDINTAQTNAASFSKHILNEVTSGANILPDTAIAVQKYLSGGMGSGQEADNKLLQWFAARRGMENSWKMQDAQFKYIKTAREYAQQGGEDEAADRMSNIASRHLDNLVNNNGTKITDLVKNPESGEGFSTKDEQWTQYGSIINGDRLKTIADMNTYLDTKNEAGLTRRQLLGSTKSEEMMNKALYFHTQTLSAIQDKDHGLVGRNLHMGTANLQDYFNTTFLNNPDRRNIAGLMFSVKEAGGANGIAQTVLGTQMLTSGMVKDAQTSFAIDAMKMGGQRTGEWEPGADRPKDSAGPITVGQLLEQASLRGIKDPNYLKALSEAGPVNMNLKNTDKLNMNWATAYYHPENQGTIMKFNKDTVENGQTVKGYQHVYNVWYSPKQTEVMLKLNKTYPGAYEMYRTSAEKSFQSILLNDLPDLVKQSEDRGITFHWNDTENKIEARIKSNVDKVGPALKGDTAARERVTLDNVNRVLLNVNNNIRNLVPIEQARGSNPGEVMTKAFATKGIDISSWLEPEDKTSGTKVMKYSGDEPTKASLGSFLKNPVSPLGTLRFNAPVTYLGASGGNLGDILGIQVDDIPEGMSARDFIKQLREKGK